MSIEWLMIPIIFVNSLFASYLINSSINDYMRQLETKPTKWTRTWLIFSVLTILTAYACLVFSLLRRLYN